MRPTAADRRPVVGGPGALGETMPAYFEIHEACDGEWQRLRLDGELDLGSVPALRDRLTQLRGERRPVQLDLSGLTFMDSSGVHALLEAFNDARRDQWRLVVGGALSPQVDRLFHMTRLDRIFAVNGQ